MKTLVSLLLIIALLGNEVPVYPQSTDPPPTPQTASARYQNQCWFGPFILLVILGVGTYYGIRALCDAAGLIPKKDNPPPPPPYQPPPLPWCTNAVPGHPDWPHTNCWPDNPNVTFCPPIHVKPGDIGFWDIESAGYVAPNGDPYVYLQSLTIETSTNGLNWIQVMSCTNWVAKAGGNITGLMCQVYTNGVAIATKWTANPPIDTNTIVEIGVDQSAHLPSQFFRVTP